MLIRDSASSVFLCYFALFRYSSFRYFTSMLFQHSLLLGLSLSGFSFSRYFSLVFRLSAPSVTSSLRSHVTFSSSFFASVFLLRSLPLPLVSSFFRNFVFSAWLFRSRSLLSVRLSCPPVVRSLLGSPVVGFCPPVVGCLAL